MAIAFSQWTAKGGGSVASITTTGITTTSGNLLVAICFCDTNKIGATPITDSKGNTWVQAIGSVGSSTYLAIFYCANATGGAAHTFTFTPTSSEFIAIAVLEISGAKTSSVLGSTSTSTSNTASHDSGNITSNGITAEVLIGAWNPASATAMGPGAQVGAGSGWSWNYVAANGSNEGGFFGYRIVGLNVTDSFKVTAASAAASPIAVAGFLSTTPPVGGSAFAFA